MPPASAGHSAVGQQRIPGMHPRPLLPRPPDAEPEHVARLQVRRLRPGAHRNSKGSPSNRTAVVAWPLCGRGWPACRARQEW